MDLDKESDALENAVKTRMKLKAGQVIVTAISEISAEADIMILQALGIDATQFLLKTIISECQKLVKED